MVREIIRDLQINFSIHLSVMKKVMLILVMVLAVSPGGFGQRGLAFKYADKESISVEELERTHKNAVHGDTSKAVFKTEMEQQAISEAFVKLLQDFGNFLSGNDFLWDKPTRCFNRIYFNSDGTIGYFLFNFTGKPEDQPSTEKQQEFQRLLNLFIKDYKIAVSAEKKFAYCSGTVYMPKEDKELEEGITD